MPEVITRIPDALELLQYGYFHPWTYPIITIDADDAVSITAAQTNDYMGQYTATTATESVEQDLIDLRGVSDWCGLILHWNFGDTSRPDKVYFQIHTKGQVLPNQYSKGFAAGGYVSDSNIEQYVILPPFDDSFKLEFWNATGGAPEDVWIDVSMILYLFPKYNLPKVMNMSTHNQFSRVVDQLVLLTDMGEQPPSGEQPPWDEIVELLKEIAGKVVKFEHRI